jgi:multidrug resistance efflux pump
MFNKYTAVKLPFSFKFIPFYFFLLILIFTIPFCYLDVLIEINKTGKIKIHSDNNYIFSSYEGRVEEVFINEGDYIKKGSEIANIKIKYNKKNIDNKINKLEETYKKYKNEHTLNKINSLKKITNNRVIISDKEGVINDIFVQNGDILKEFDKIAITNKDKKYYIKSYFSIEEIEHISINKKIYLKLDNVNEKYFLGIISNIYSYERNPSLYNVEIIPFFENTKVLENQIVHISITKKKYTFSDWFFF